MPFYYTLKRQQAEKRRRTASFLLALREQLRQEIPPRTRSDSLLLATWNIRDFDSNKFRHGPRLKESFFYIAEIISAFDVVALQEVNEDLRALSRVMRILGPSWEYVATDETAGRSGNRERMVFLFDKSKVSFQNIAGEIVLPITQLVEGERQFARTPFLVAFQGGWFKFMLCTVHIYYGSSSGAGLARRIEEIDRIAAFLSKRADDSEANYVLLGDFNIVSPEHKTMQALVKHGFIIPHELWDVPSNWRQDKFYDQIAFKSRPGEVRFGENCGVFDFYKSVFRETDAETYFQYMDAEKRDFDSQGNPRDEAGKAKYYADKWRTFQMSDHLPMWVELGIDFSEEYLEKLRS